MFGATVELLNMKTEQLVCYQIVGEDEADIKLNLISIRSPIARALIGKEVRLSMRSSGSGMNKLRIFLAKSFDPIDE